jgi:ribose transport system permease protein
MSARTLGHRTRKELLVTHPWVWSFIAIALEWAALTALVHRGMLGTFQAALTLAPYLVIVSIGQMFVITLGNGNVDLSIPYVMPMAAYIAAGVSGANGQHLWLGIIAGVLSGMAAGLVSAFGILVLSIPPIVCTLAVGLFAQTVAYVRAANFTGNVPNSLVTATLDKFLGIPLFTFACIAFSVLAGVLLHRSPYGRAVQAIGQNKRAANLAGIRVPRIILLTYLLSGALAAVSGVMLAAFSGLSLDIGSTFLLTSIAAVVIGGSVVAGGRSNVPGVWGGALFLGLTVTLLEAAQASIAVQDIGEGVLIIAVLTVAGRATSVAKE